MREKKHIVLMNHKRIIRSLKRIAYQIAEQKRAQQNLLLAGINTRGYAVARALHGYLKLIVDYEISCIQLHTEKSEDLETQLPPEKDVFIVLADDVIFSGRTMFTALLKLNTHLPLQEVHTVSLVDRGHRKLPIKAEFAGIRFSTKLNEHVSVQLDDQKNIEKVLLFKE